MYKSTTTEITVHSENDSPIFGETATRIRIEDEAGGEFLSLSQDTNEGGYQILKFDFEEFEAIIQAVNEIRTQIKKATNG